MLENPIIVSGSIFVGWEQYYDEIINVGLDRNTINNNRMYYNLGAGWNLSNCADCDGTWMIRPVFGNLSTSSIEDFSTVSLNIFPNPANTYVNIEFSKSFALSIFNLSGELVHNDFSDGSLGVDLVSFSKGIYILEILSDNRKYRKKLVVQ